MILQNMRGNSVLSIDDLFAERQNLECVLFLPGIQFGMLLFCILGADLLHQKILIVIFHHNCFIPFDNVLY